MVTATPGLAEALNAVAALSDSELTWLVDGGRARLTEANEAGHQVDAQAAEFYLALALVEIERRCLVAAR